MENKETAILLIEKLKLKPKRKCLGETAEFLMSVDSFRYEDLCKEFGIVRDVAYNRINSLKRNGFVFKYLSRTKVDGGTFTLVDCRGSEPKPRKAYAMQEESAINLVFVDKSDVSIPEYPYLWKKALGLAKPDFSQCDVDF